MGCFLVDRNNLRIQGLMTVDSGIFQCIASNAAGNIQAAAHLTVLPEGETTETGNTMKPRYNVFQ